MHAAEEVQSSCQIRYHDGDLRLPLIRLHRPMRRPNINGLVKVPYTRGERSSLVLESGGG